MRTITYQDLLSKYTSMRGVDTLLDHEKVDFSNSLNHRIKQIWVKHKWPDLTVVVEKTLQVIDNDTVKAEKAVRIDNADNLYDVFGVFDSNPYEQRVTERYEYTLIDGHLVLAKGITATSVFIVGSKVPADDYGEGYFSGQGRSDIPAFMEWMLLSYTMADFYRADGQNEKAMIEEKKGDEHMQEALDRFERVEGQNRIPVVTYPPRSLGVSRVTTQRNI